MTSLPQPKPSRFAGGALAARWRRELAGDEARLAAAAAVLATARQEETDAGLALAGREVGAGSDAEPEQRAVAAARTRLRYATTGRELAWLGFHLARARTALSAGVLRLVEPAGTRR